MNFFIFSRYKITTERAQQHKKKIPTDNRVNERDIDINKVEMMAYIQHDQRETSCVDYGSMLSVYAPSGRVVFAARWSAATSPLSAAADADAAAHGRIVKKNKANSTETPFRVLPILPPPQADRL